MEYIRKKVENKGSFEDQAQELVKYAAQIGADATAHSSDYCAHDEYLKAKEAESTK